MGSEGGAESGALRGPEESSEVPGYIVKNGQGAAPQVF
ncbi:hypothetical protein TRIP_B50081 [uncultured Desulfatiglans sp.]|uniref:Uncharacterized protein n=1 Tax=Uncultured Desulfatiglans sp. TaxID=1748965 RepID=A0A653AG17_UNCDX|nr:hypothetical protein TRIP_B50081 [uncultured Desulfatiglans sp.]